jgi:WD40 repeat protein
MVSVYVSSTYRDLKDYRDAVISALRRMKHHVVCMEDYGAADQRPLDKCLRDVEECDVYVGIFAWLYGYAPQEDNPAGRSITELEYRRARDAKKECLIFLLEDDHPWSPSLIDNGSSRARVEALRKELCTRHLVSFFRTQSDLAAHVATAIHNINQTVRSPAPDDDQDAEPSITLPAGLQRNFKGHTDAVECVALSADGRKAASGGWDKRICVWDLQTGRLQAQLLGHSGTLSHPGIVYEVAFAPDGNMLVSSGYDGTIRLWDLSTGRQLRKLVGHEGSVTALALSDDGRVLVSGGGSDRTVRVWQLDTFREVYRLTGHRGPIHRISVSGDGKLAVSAGTDGQLRLWDLRAGKELPRFKPTSALLSVDLSADGSLALTADIEGNICLFDVESGIEVRRFAGHGKAVKMAVMSADLRRMLSGSHDGTMRLWNLSSGEQIEQFDDHRCPVVAVAVSADATLAVSGGADHMVRLWRLPA